MKSPILAALLLFLASHAFAQSAPVRMTRTLARGVELIQEITPEGSADGPLAVTVIKVDPKAKGVRIEAALGQDRVWGTDPTFGREIVSTLAARHGAVAAMNAGFFPFMGNPIGLHIQGGEIVTEPLDARTCFLITKSGAGKIAAFGYTGEVQMSGGNGGEDGPKMAIDGLNRKPGKGDELLLFTPIFFDATLKTPGRIEAILSGISHPLKPGKEYTGRVTQVTENGNTPLTKGTVVLSGGGAGAELLRGVKPGTHIKFRLETPALRDVSDDEVIPAGIADIREAVAGGPRLLSGGKITIPLAEEKMSESFSTTRHPRSAVGITADGKILFLTVDGRQKGLSRGASLPETAALLLKFGAVEAVNMDGGGSTALVALDSVVNSPSEGKERPVSNMLLIFGDRPEVKSSPSVLRQAEMTVRVGDPLNFPGGDAKTVWGTVGGVIFVNQEGRGRALRPGKGVVRLIQGDKRFVFPVNVRGADAGDAPGFAAILTWENGADAGKSDTSDRATLKIRIANAEGDRLGGETVRLTVVGGAADTETVTTDSRGEASVPIRWTTPATKERSVTVSSPNERFRKAVGGRR